MIVPSDDTTTPNSQDATDSPSSQATFRVDKNYNKNDKPNALTDVTISLYINRISNVDETKEELSFDIFLQAVWVDPRVTQTVNKTYTELTQAQRHQIWVPDLYIRQLRKMKILTLFEEISSLRLYNNSTISFSIGATLCIKCDMDFVLYPLDVQKCNVDFSSYKHDTNEMTFRWREFNSLTFPRDYNEGFFRLPRYIVSFRTVPEPKVVNYGEDDHYSARLEITLSRELKSYIVEIYLPSTLFVSMSWGSFIVIPEVVPGRMVLLVTTLLSLLTMFDTLRANSPDALELKCIEVWLISCSLFVFVALMEYLVVLFGIRYDRHWKEQKSMGASERIETVIPHTQGIQGMQMEPLTRDGSPSRNGLEQGSIRYTGGNKILPDPRTTPPYIRRSPSIKNPTLYRVGQTFENWVLYAGSGKGKIDQISLVLFPISFLIFTIAYWSIYLTESRRRM